VYGQSSLATYLGIAFAVLLVIALFAFASPLIAVLLAGAIGAFMLIAMSAQRRRSEAEDANWEPPLTPEGKPTGPTGRSSGAPASGEGT
jgi:hypothetical protein